MCCSSARARRSSPRPRACRWCRPAISTPSAVTSTGGLTNKYYGRVGDSPIIGAGTYASNLSCGVSGTGTGEYFIRLGVGKSIADLMLYKGLKLAEAADQVVMHDLVQLG